MSVDLYLRSLISHINGLKPHLQACSCFRLILFWNLAPFFHLWPHKLGPFHKHATWPSLIIMSLSNFKRRRKNRRVGYKWALSLSWPIRYTYLAHRKFSNKSSTCTGDNHCLVYRLLVFVKIMVVVWILKKADGFWITEEVILNFVKWIA